MDRRPTRDEVEGYLARMGKRGAATLSTLGKLQPFAECLETELGQALLGTTIVRYEELLEKVSELKATDEDKVEFRITKQILLEMATRLGDYSRKVKEIKGGK